MEIEVVEYYPMEKKNKNARLLGTMHVYLCDEKIDLRGVKIYKGGKSYFVEVPFSYGIDEETKEKVKYPYLSFIENDKQEDFIKSLRAAAKTHLFELKNEKKKKKGK